jgi:minor extracellular serine protease Vpr
MVRTHIGRWAFLLLLILLLAACNTVQRSSDEVTPLATQRVQEVFPQNPVPSAGTGAPTIEATNLWFVELTGAPVADRGSRGAIQREQNAFRNAVAQERLRYQERFAFQNLFNGFSAQVSPGDVSKLSHLPGVKAIYPVVTVSIPETQAALEPELITALAMTGADVAQSEHGLTGQGIRVAVMDTGIDYNHPDLGGPCFGPGCRVVTGFDFVGDEFNAADPANDTPAPNDDPMDCNGHGTHVAGIVGADGEVTGVAPGVTFGAYKVFGCEGSTFADIMLAAMEMALADGMHVLNMSIGAAFQWPQYPTGQASDRLVNRGMVVVASAGNSGANGVYSMSAPGVGDKVIGVASFDNSHINALTFNVNPSGQQVPYLPLSTTPDPPTEGTTPEVVYIGRGCTSLGDTPLADPDGKVALIVRGDCTFDEKYQGAASAGAVGVVIHNNVTGLFAGGGVTSQGIFGVGISQSDGLHIRSLLDANETVTLTWTDERVNAPNPTGGLTSSFSSYGLAPDLTLKPDIGAPGGLIRSTYPLALGGYATVSGTSMSAPHVAGGVALLLEARPRTPSQAVRGILQNSADPKLWWGNPGLGFLDNVHRQGAGMLDIPGAILSTTKVEPAKLSLGESEAGPATRTLRIENSSSEAVTYNLSHVPALSTGGSTFSPSFFTGFASVAFSNSSVTVPAGGTVSVDVTITANPGLPDRSQYGGYIVLTGDNGVARVPYAGFKGDYQSILVLNPAASPFGNPLLRPSLTFEPSEPVTIKPEDGEVAWIFVHLDHQVRRLRMEVRDADTGRSYQRAYDLEYVGRNSTAGAFFTLPWDGTTTRGGGRHTTEVPSGDYVIELSILKALGDANNPDHWESWTSPVITVDRQDEPSRPGQGRGRP